MKIYHNARDRKGLEDNEQQVFAPKQENVDNYERMEPELAGGDSASEDTEAQVQATEKTQKARKKKGYTGV